MWVILNVATAGETQEYNAGYSQNHKHNNSNTHVMSHIYNSDINDNRDWMYNEITLTHVACW